MTNQANSSFHMETRFFLMCQPFPPRSLPFFGATGTAKNRRDHAVALMTRRLVHWPFCFRPRNFRGPRLGPRGGIFNRELVNHGGVRTAREAFDEMELFAGSSDNEANHVIRNVDHPRITI